MSTQPTDTTKSILKKTELVNESIPDTVADRAFNLLINSQTYKQPRMNQMMMYEALYNNDVPPKLRQMFNVPIPVFAGMIDTLLSDFNDQVQIKFNPLNPAQYLITPKVQALWEAERDSLAPNARWNYKARSDRFNAALSGRGILLEFAENDPKYRNVLEIINYSDFHCQPLGGGLLENHLFVGREGVFRTEEELAENETYDQEQVKKLIDTAFSDELWQTIHDTYGTKLVRFKSLGLDIDSNTFAGTRTFNLCEFIITFRGERYYVLFEPNTKIWVRCCPWKEICPSGMYPFKSWATHEDDKNFWSKSFADDLYWSADSIITMFNQELTNREKKNFNARAFDKEMFTDVQKLDQAQFRPDALVPADTKGGTRRISEGIYEFSTPELQGTVNLIGFISNFTAQNVGVSEQTIGAPKESRKPTVVLAQNQQISKRIGYRSDSFKECYSELGLAYLEGLREYMPSSVSVQVIGENGFIEEQELKRIEVTKAGDIGISVSSTSEQEGSDTLKRDGRMKAIEMIASNPNLTRWEKETILRDVGQFDESEINFAFDNQSYSSKKQIAHASRAIQDILLNREPDVYYGADISYLEYLNTFIVDHKVQIKGKEARFASFMNTVAPIVQDNMGRKASSEGMIKPGEQQKPDDKPATPAPAPEAGNKPSIGKLDIPSQAQRMGQLT